MTTAYLQSPDVKSNWVTTSIGHIVKSIRARFFDQRLLAVFRFFAAPGWFALAKGWTRENGDVTGWAWYDRGSVDAEGGWHTVELGKWGRVMLEWHGPDEHGVLRAHDDFALYVISDDESGHYRVSYFPSPGPECQWGRPFDNIEEAKRSAEDCVQFVLDVRKSHRLVDSTKNNES